MKNKLTIHSKENGKFKPNKPKTSYDKIKNAKNLKELQDALIEFLKGAY